MAVPAKSVTQEVWMFFRISLPRLLISGSLKSVYCSTKSTICLYRSGRPLHNAMTCCTNRLPNRPNMAHRMMANMSSANIEADARFQPCLTSGTTTGSTASARNSETMMSMTRYSILPQLRQQKENSTMAMAMYSSARPSHSGGRRGSPFAGNRVPRSQRISSVLPGRPDDSVFVFFCRSLSLMAPYCRQTPCTGWNLFLKLC